MQLQELEGQLRRDPDLANHAPALRVVTHQNANLASMVVMLVRRLRRHAPNDDLAHSAMAYLARENLHGSPFRGGVEHPSEDLPASVAALPARKSEGDHSSSSNQEKC